jgi:hypothetical protein
MLWGIIYQESLLRYTSVVKARQTLNQLQDSGFKLVWHSWETVEEIWVYNIKESCFFVKSETKIGTINIPKEKDFAIDVHYFIEMSILKFTEVLKSSKK